MGNDGDGVANVTGGLLDRSKVHILLCDSDPESGLQVLKLLQKCSYQVTCVKSAGQVMAVLDTSSFEVDLILAEVELPKQKGFKLLKHIVRQEQLQRIPVVMMSSQDEMALVVRCLRLGAVDFLLKPLRSNELLNLWTHTWRRRRMLGLTEMHLMKGNRRVPLDLLVSETSESNNTNSTNLFSDDTDDHKISTTVSMPPPGNRGLSQDLKLELSLKPSMVVMLDATSSECGVKAGSLRSPPRKSELKVGQLSAFFTYNKVINQPTGCLIDGKQLNPTDDSLSKLRPEHLDSTVDVGEEPRSLSCPNLYVPSLEEHVFQRPSYPWVNTSCRRDGGLDFRETGATPSQGPFLSDQPAGNALYNEHYPQEVMANSTTPHFLVGGPVLHCPPMLPPPVQLYQGLLAEDVVATGVAAGIPSAHMPQGLTITNSFPYYPFGLHVVAAPQLGAFPGWHPPMANPLLERKLGQAERREAALNKFRLKRKDRCFEKKIRYVSRKKLAEQRPRIRGQFVRREADNDANDNGGLDEFDDDDDEQGLCDVGEGSSFESIAEDA